MKTSLQELQTIPGIGKSLALDLVGLGIRRVRDLKNRDPERLYRKLNMLRGFRTDRCVLYAFRCAVYFASETKPDPRLLKWWNWSDGNLKKADGAVNRKSAAARRGGRR